MTQLVWTPAVGNPITLATGAAAEYRLLSLDGIGPVAAQALTSKGPGQVGSTALDMSVPERVVSAQVLVQGHDLDDLWDLRADLGAAMASEPVPSGGTIALGTLKLVRGGSWPDLEIPALPNSVSIEMPRSAGHGVIPADLEWTCPYPFWRATSDETVNIPTHSTPVDVPNAGDALCPAIIRIHGDLTLVCVTDATPSPALAFELSGQIPAGQYVEVDTTPGEVSVELVNGGVRTNWMSHLNISVADLFQLAVGANVVSWTRGVDGGSGTRAVVFTYRPRQRGV